MTMTSVLPAILAGSGGLKAAAQMMMTLRSLALDGSAKASPPDLADSVRIVRKRKVEILLRLSWEGLEDSVDLAGSIEGIE
jgi:hypothetical protein